MSISLNIQPILRQSGSSGVGGVPSGSFALSDPLFFDVSEYSNLQVSALAWDGIAGTASIVVSNVPDVINGGKTNNPYTPMTTLLTLNVPEASLGVNDPVTSSLTPICWKWMGVAFEATSGSAGVTGSAVVSLTLK